LAASAFSSLLVRITVALLWICLRMLFVVARPIIRLPRELRWLQVVLLLTFVAVFFYRPAIAYYWFWGSVFAELSFLVIQLLFGERDSLRAWLRRAR
jgi:hypothetical protein